jgi:hypothetical protein
MRKVIAVLILTVLMTGAALADTLYLMDGSRLKGTFVGYENGKFIFETGGNRLEYRPDQVRRLVVDRNDTVGSAPGRDDRYPSRDPNNTPSSPGGRWDSAAAFDVRLEDQWYRSSIQVTRGQRVRVDASGTIYLGGRTASGPEGLQGKRDPDGPMPEQNDGALVAAIGQDTNLPSILIGRSREFTADRSGTLYFTINHWDTRDARGSYRVSVSVDRSTYGGEVGGGTPGGSRPNQNQKREKTVTVYANQAWTDTGIDVEPNTTYEITADGTIDIGDRARSNPDGNREATVRNSSYPMNDVPAGALIGKIRYRDGRDSNYVFIGSRGAPASEPNEYGRLFLGINDSYVRDNTGSYRVTIRW